MNLTDSKLVMGLVAAQSEQGESAATMQTAKKKLPRLRQLKALQAAIGAWKDEGHPELKHGAAVWVAKLLKQDEKRYRGVGAGT